MFALAIDWEQRGRTPLSLFRCALAVALRGGDRVFEVVPCCAVVPCGRPVRYQHTSRVLRFGSFVIWHSGLELFQLVRRTSPLSKGRAQFVSRCLAGLEVHPGTPAIE